MATTPPPLPSSDEGEFDDDDDFGCFTSSTPITPGKHSDLEDDFHPFQEHSDPKDTPNTAAKTASVIQTPSSKKHLEDDETKLPNVVCNGEQGKGIQTGVISPRVPDDSNSVVSESELDKTKDETKTSCDHDAALDKTTSSEADADSSPHVAASISNHSSEPHDNVGSKESIVPDSSVSDKEKSCDLSSSEVNNLKSPPEDFDDWADFSAAPSDVIQPPPENQEKEETGGANANENFQPSDQVISHSSDEVHVTTSEQEESDFQTTSDTSETVEPMKTIDENSENEVGNSCYDSSSKDQSGPDHVAEADNVENVKLDSCEGQDIGSVKSDSGEREEAESNSPVGQATPASNSDSEVQSEERSEPSCAHPVSETNNHSDELEVPSPDKSCVNNDYDDDDFGDFSDFPSNTAKESVSNDDVAPISFRTSTCDEGVEGEEEDDNNFDEKTTVDSPTVEGGGSPLPYEEDEEEEDWGFKAADDSMPKSTESNNDDFGDFGSNTQGHPANDNSDWADFNVSSTPDAAATSEAIKEDELQSQSLASSSSATSPQPGLSKLEKAISSSFPTDHETSFFGLKEEKAEEDNTCQEGEDNAIEKSDVNGLEAVVTMGLKVLPSAKQETWTITKEIRIKDPMVGIWERLKDVNACHALDFGWTSSQCSQDVYNTLHIDTQNVLFSQKKQAVPFFASGLGILEPIRGGSSQPERQPAPPPLLDTSKPEESQKEPTQDIPPVDFDWSSSGLTDPLKVFKSDTFNSGLSSFEPFAEILQKSSIAGQGSTEKELSSEAKSFLKKIPNLRFMQSKVLMFPIKDS